MRSSSSFGSPADNARHRPRVRGTRAILLLTALCLGVASLAAQSSSKGDQRRGGNDSERRGPSPQEIQTRALTNLRERFGVIDDEEWDVIAERLLKLFELRRSAADGGGFSRGGPPGGSAAAAAAAKSRGGSFRGSGGTPEIQSLQAAVTEKLPDAELKLRLARLRDVRQLNEAKLRKAQEDLRAVLTVRQEAIAVLLGLLP